MIRTLQLSVTALALCLSQVSLAAAPSSSAASKAQNDCPFKPGGAFSKAPQAKRQTQIAQLASGKGLQSESAPVPKSKSTTATF